MLVEFKLSILIKAFKKRTPTFDKIWPHIFNSLYMKATILSKMFYIFLDHGSILWNYQTCKSIFHYIFIKNCIKNCDKIRNLCSKDLSKSNSKVLRNEKHFKGQIVVISMWCIEHFKIRGLFFCLPPLKKEQKIKYIYLLN